jgi:hypothetical protein
MNCKIDMEGIVTKWVNKFPEIGVKYNKIVASNLFPTDVSVSPDLTKVVVSYSYSGRIDIFDFTGTLLLNYFGPDYKKLDISLSEKTKAPALTSKNVETYWSADLNNKSFMIPYSGKKRTKSTLYENVLHFDYEGNLIARYKLDPAVADIQVDWKNRIIFGLNNSLEPSIYKYKF